MRKYILLSLILFYSHFIIAQIVEVETFATYVIANGGLNLRSEPSVKAKKLANIPFGSTIKYLSEKSFNIDSVLIYYSDYPKPNVIYGNWVKIEYKKIKGYVLDIYLSGKSDKEDRFDDVFAHDYILLYPGCGCNTENIHDPNGWKWFGYFRDGVGKFKVDEVKISYYSLKDITCGLIIYASKNDSLEFIIGSKNGGLSTKKEISGKNIWLVNYTMKSNKMDSELKKISLELIENKDANVWKPSKLYLLNERKRQLLNRPEYDYPLAIDFAGDLDGDLKDDYIIHYGDKGGIKLLYLTTKAKSGNLIEKVAMFFSSYCC